MTNPQNEKDVVEFIGPHIHSSTFWNHIISRYSRYGSPIRHLYNIYGKYINFNHLSTYSWSLLCLSIGKVIPRNFDRSEVVELIRTFLRSNDDIVSNYILNDPKYKEWICDVLISHSKSIHHIIHFSNVRNVQQICSFNDDILTTVISSTNLKLDGHYSLFLLLFIHSPHLLRLYDLNKHGSRSICTLLCKLSDTYPSLIQHFDFSKLSRTKILGVIRQFDDGAQRSNYLKIRDDLKQFV
jgi:hypothetical protein